MNQIIISIIIIIIIMMFLSEGRTFILFFCSTKNWNIFTRGSFVKLSVPSGAVTKTLLSIFISTLMKKT